MSNIKNMQASQEFTDAFNHCVDLLRQNNYITNSNSNVISRQAAVFGQYMYEYLMQCRFIWIYQKSENQIQKVPVDLSSEINQVDSIHSTPEIEFSETTAATSSETDGVLGNTEINSSDSNGLCYTIQIGQLPMPKHQDEINEVVNERAMVPFVKPVGSNGDEKSFSNSSENSINITPRMACNKPLTRKIYAMSKNTPQTIDDLYKSSDDHNNSDYNDGSIMNESQKPSGKKKVVSIEEKQKVVELAQANPTWPLELLQKYGSPKLKTLTQLRTWQRQINKGASVRDSFQMIERWTYANYIDAVKNQRKITRKMIREWAVQAGTLFLDSKNKKAFKASTNWMSTFLQKYNVQLKGKRSKVIANPDEEE